jgi:hypothetical protein
MKRWEYRQLVNLNREAIRRTRNRWWWENTGSKLLARGLMAMRQSAIMPRLINRDCGETK